MSTITSIPLNAKINCNKNYIEFNKSLFQFDFKTKCQSNTHKYNNIRSSKDSRQFSYSHSSQQIIGVHNQLTQNNLETVNTLRIILYYFKIDDVIKSDGNDVTWKLCNILRKTRDGKIKQNETRMFSLEKIGFLFIFEYVTIFKSVVENLQQYFFFRKENSRENYCFLSYCTKVGHCSALFIYRSQFVDKSRPCMTDPEN